jgi:hypothetical protein
MSTEDEIAFLEDLRGKIVRYLFLGYSPSESHTLWGGSEGLFQMREALEKPAFQNLRREINEGKGRAHQCLSNAGVACIYEQWPAPMFGGPVLSFKLFDLVTQNATEKNIELHVFTDKIDEAIGVLRHALAQPLTGPEKINEVAQGFVFIAMPMAANDPQLEDVHDAIRDASTAIGLRAERVDEPESNERITDRILESLRLAEFVVADLTHGKPNVYYEAGYAHALGKLPVYIARTETHVEFDLKDYPVIFFRNNRELKLALEKRLRGLVAKRQG